MENSNISITVDILGKIKKIKEGKTFSDSLVIITELFQNAQRAGAKNVYVDLADGRMTFTDDGCGCKKPEDVFTLDHTAWELTDEGFGIGLWSWLAFPEVMSMQIASHNWKSFISLSQLLKGDLNTNIIYVKDKVKGFSVNLEYDYINTYPDDIYNRIYKDAEMQMYNVYINDELVDKKDLHASVDGDFVKTFSNRLFEATLRPTKCWDYIDCYYERRLVDNFHPGRYVSGVIEIKKNALTLQEPDRKNVVGDNKRYVFINKVDECIKQMYLDIVKSADNTLIEKYADEINNVLDVSDYEKYILVDDLILSVAEEKRNIESMKNKANALDGLVNLISKMNNDTQLSLTDNIMEDKDIEKVETLLNSSSDTHKWVKTNMYSYEADVNANLEEISENILEENKSLLIGKTVYKKVNVSDYKEMFKDEDEDIYSIITMHKTKKEKKKDYLRSVIKKTNKKVWVKASEIEEYTDLIAKVEYYGVKVFIAKNILHERVFESNNVAYISSIESGIIKRNIKWDVELKTKKEERFIELLQPILSYYNLPLNTFKVGYLKLMIETYLDDKIINREIIENRKDSINLYAVTDGVEIILDRRAIGLSRFNLQGENVGINEIKALMASLKTISHELAHLIYETEDNTKYHRECEDNIYDELVSLYLTM